MRSPIIAGLIAGIVSGILMIILDLSGLWELLSVLRFIPAPASRETIALIEAITFIVWGIIWGAFYAFFYDYVPGDGIKKGLTYGLIVWIIAYLRNGVVCAAYGLFSWGFLWTLTGFFSVGITYGLVLGALYKK